MSKVVVSSHDRTGEWIDIADPTPEELETAAEGLGLPTSFVSGCLDPSHLPKTEVLGDKRFYVFRHADQATYALKDSDTVNELTRKIAVFVTESKILTIHRKDQPLLTSLRERWKDSPRTGTDFVKGILVELSLDVVRTYTRPLEHAEEAFEDYEAKIFMRVTEASLIEDVYFLKRKISVYKRMLRLTQELVPSLVTLCASGAVAVHELKKDIGRSYFYADELAEDIAHLLDIHISLASHRTNEVMRVLTLFSVFFMPLTFIVGVYGMNFQYMPELSKPWGYPATWGVMIGLSLAILVWFRHKGWLR